MLFRRLSAYIIDRVIVVLVGTFPLWSIEIYARIFDKVYVWSYFPICLPLFFISFYIFYILFLEGLYNGQTIGKKIFRIRVVDKNYNPINIKKSIILDLLGFFVDLQHGGN